MIYNEYNNTIRKTSFRIFKKIKEYPRQTYQELILNMIKLYKNVKEKNQYDESLHKIQQQKMKELWENKEDEACEKA